MANRVLRDWTDEQIQARINEIDNQLLGMPKAENENRRLQPLKWSLYSEKRRLRMALAKRKGTHSFSDGVEFLKKHNFKCSNCGSTDNPSLDHVIPISAGGSDSLENKDVLCIRCNSSKGNRHGK